MLHKNLSDDVVLALAEASIDPRTGNRVLYSVDWVADRDSMIGTRNEDWVRRELEWFASGSNSLDDMPAPVPAAFQACAGRDNTVNSAYGHILFGRGEELPNRVFTLLDQVINAFLTKGKGTRHGVLIVSDRDVHHLSTKNGRQDFICTNALNFMIDADDKLHIVAQMRSMDAVWGYRADYSMWDYAMQHVLGALSYTYPEVTEGQITFQVANLHVYPRHHDLLQRTAKEILQRQDQEMRDAFANHPTFADRMGARQMQAEPAPEAQPVQPLPTDEQSSFGYGDEK